MLLGELEEAGVRKATILLNEPISNSGRLKTRIAEIVEEHTICVDIQILKDVDRTLYGKTNVITSDSVILNQCTSWVNLTAKCMEIQEKQGLQVW